MVDLVQIRVALTGGKAAAAEAQALSGAIAETGVAASAANKKAAASMTATGRSLKQQGTAMKRVGRGMSTWLTLPLIGAGIWAVKTAADFQKSMAQVKAATGLGERGMDQMSDLAEKMGRDTIFSANESAEAMLDLVKAGIGPAEVKAGALAATMNLAATEGLDLAKTGQIIGASMNTFGLKAKQAKLITDALAGGSLASSASVEGLSQSLQQAGASAAGNNLTIHETVGALALLAQNGIAASDAGTSLKTFLMRLNPVTKKAADEMAKYGLDFFNANGEMKSMAKVGGELRKHLGGLTTEERQHALAIMFGSDAQRAANIIYGAGAGGVQKYTRATEKRGSAEKMAKAQMEGLPGAIEKLKGALEGAALSAGEALAPAFEAVATVIETLAEGFSKLPKSTQTIVIGFLAIAAVAGPVIFVLGSMAVAFGALGIAIAPVSLAALAILALGIAFTLAYTKVKPFHDAVDAVVDFLGGPFKAMVAWIALPFMPLIAIIVVVVTHFGTVKRVAATLFDWFKNSGFGHILMAPFQASIAVIKHVVGWIKTLIGLVKDALDWLGKLDFPGGGGGEVHAAPNRLPPGTPGGPAGPPTQPHHPGSGINNPGKGLGVDPLVPNFPRIGGRGRNDLSSGLGGGGDRIRPSSRAASVGRSGGRSRPLTVPVYIGKRQVAEAVAEIGDDDKARL